MLSKKNKKQKPKRVNKIAELKIPAAAPGSAVVRGHRWASQSRFAVNVSGWEFIQTLRTGL